MAFPSEQSDLGQDALTRFEGKWHVRRRICDALSGRVSLFKGVALISLHRFEENGVLSLEGDEISGRRVYLLAWSRDSVAVSFGDSRLFVRLNFSSPQRVEHRCGEDIYRGALVFGARDGWMETWAVRGPRKSYLSASRYLRV